MSIVQIRRDCDGACEGQAVGVLQTGSKVMSPSFTNIALFPQISPCFHKYRLVSSNRCQICQLLYAEHLYGQYINLFHIVAYL